MVTASKSINLQDSFLNQVRKENVAVIVYLVNGFQLKGLVRGFDNFTVILENDGKQQLIYKHAISTITPLQAMQIMSPERPPCGKPPAEQQK
ncbi:MAG: RNA chaperone Hfq [Acidaminococcales bacterium]|jgi:host factor-I protein|nr:RNA chaperone Hfq [Acidaminococcales bacterium]